MSDIEALLAAVRAQAKFSRLSAKTADDHGAALLEADALRWEQLADNAENELRELKSYIQAG